MTHRHERGNLVTQFYVALRNQDQTEGRGPMIEVGAFANARGAYNRVKGEGVMGCGDGDIIKRTYYNCETCPEFIKVDDKIYVGDRYSQNNLVGKSPGYLDFMPDGWHVDYSSMAKDPEYKEYLRLREKFEKK